MTEDNLKPGGNWEYLVKDGVDDKAFETAAKEKIYVFDSKGNKVSLVYSDDYLITEYTNNKVDVSKLTFDETGYASQTATATIKGEGNYTGSRTIQFTIRVKKTA